MFIFNIFAVNYPNFKVKMMMINNGLLLGLK